MGALTRGRVWARSIWRNWKLGREFILIGIGQLIAMVGSLVGVRLMTNMLSPQVYGEMALGLVGATLVAQILTGPLSNAAARFFAPAAEAGELTSFTNDLRSLLLTVSGLVFATLLLVVIALLVTQNAHWARTAVAAAAFALLSGYSAVLSGVQNAARQRAVVAWHQVLGTWGRFAFAVVLVRLFGKTSAWALTGFAMASALVLVSQLWFFSRLLRSKSDAARDKHGPYLTHKQGLLSYAKPFMITGAFVFAQDTSDKWALQWFTTTEDLGRYGALYQIGYSPLVILGGLLSQLFMPVYFARIGDASDPTRIRNANALNTRLLRATLGLTVIIASLMVFLHRPVFSLLVGPQYRGVSPLLPLLVLCGGMTIAVQWASLYQMGQLQTQRLMIPNLVGNILGVILQLAGGYLAGIAGVIGGRLSYLLLQFCWFMLLHRSAPKRPQNQQEKP